MRQWPSNFAFLCASAAVHLLVIAALPAFPQLESKQHAALQILLTDTDENPAQHQLSPAPARSNVKQTEQPLSTRKLARRSPAPPSLAPSPRLTETTSNATPLPSISSAVSKVADNEPFYIKQPDDGNSAPVTTPSDLPAIRSPAKSPALEKAHTGQPEESAAPLTEAADLKALLQEYGSKVKQAIRSHQQYPATAERLGHDGSVNLKFTISADGSLNSIQINSSSGYRELDQAAQQAVIDASPFPGLPMELGRNELSMSITIHFNL